MDFVREATSYSYDVIVIGSGGGKALGFIDELTSSLLRTGLCVTKVTGKASRAKLKSRILVFVFSEEFVSEVWLLRELVAILDSSDCVALPIFYDVDPSDIREQTGGCAAVFDMHEKKHVYSQMETWRNALRKASDLTGFLFRTQNDIPKSTRIQQIVEFIAEGVKKDNFSLWCGEACHLMKSGLTMLPENMTFPALKHLSLQDNDDLSEIPLSFFEHMPTLEFLDMSRTSIKKLPSSISHFVQLKTLFLRDCKLLMELPPEIGSLENLEVFDLKGTELIYIPEEIKKLSKLKRFIVSLCDCADEYVSEMKKNGEIIPRNTLSKLSNLKELSIFLDPSCKWWSEEVTSLIKDLINLKKLERVNLYFPTVEVMNSFLQLPNIRSRGLKNFRLIVGHHDQGIICRVPRDLQDRFEALDKCLKFVNGREGIDEVGTALKYSTAFFLERHWTIDRFYRFKYDEMGKMRFCMVVECNEMRTVIGSDNGQSPKTPVLYLLEYLCIYYMKNLESISVGQLAAGSFYSLRMLDIHACSKLTTIINTELLINLVRLEELIVEDCPKVESIPSQFESFEAFLPNLKKISLLHLPGLVSIFSGSHLAPRLACVIIFNCPKLQSNSLADIASTNMIEIKGECVWWEKLGWQINFSGVFVPFNVDGMISQLAEVRNSRNSLNMIHDSYKVQDTIRSMDKSSKPVSTAETLNKDISSSRRSPNDSKFNSIPRQSGREKSNIKLENLPGSANGKFNLDAKSRKRWKILGSGSFGVIYKGLTVNGYPIAVNEVLFFDQGKHEFKQSMDQLQQEVSVLRQLQHENIVRYFCTETDNNKLYIFLEFVDKLGSLESLYQKSNLEDSQVSVYTRQILSGLSYLHSQNVAHMDINCANILVDVNGCVKLSDFGLAKVITQIGNYSKISKHLFWMAPEAMKNGIRELGLAADIWSLGCTVLEMLTRQVPYFPLERIDALYSIYDDLLPDIPHFISEDARDFILKCLQVKPDKRPSAVQLLDHAFVVKRPISNFSTATFPTHSASRA